MPQTPEQLRDRLDACSLRASAAISRGLDAAVRRGDRDLGPIERAVERAERWARERRAGAPAVRCDASLPIAARREEIVRAIRDHRVVVICGETGSGKSTQLPLYCLEAGRGLRGFIGHTQPRRIAARTIAQRLADELGTPLGDKVGFKVRFADETGHGTYIKVMTDGVLLAEMQGDRRLLRYDTIILDEAHERSLNIDFLLGYLRRLLETRPELRVIITSATIDPARFSRHFGGAPVIEVSGRTYPVEVLYRDPGAVPGSEAEAAQPIVDAVAELAGHGPGDILVFLPGEREIREAAEALAASGEPAVKASEVMPLYARLSAKEQLRAFQPHERRRIILSTNIAETSVTVPGVHYVVDTGLARINRYSSRSRVQGLEIEPISQASANQRAGRCGRVADGVCIRLYSGEEFGQRPAFTDPEILRTNLAGVILRMKALRLGDPRKFPFLDPPSPRRIRDAYDTLLELGAIDAEHELTALGRELAAVPIDPRLGRMVLAAAHEGALREVLIIVAALATRDPRERPMDLREKADAAHKQFADEGSDFLTLLNIWRAFREKERELSGRRLRRWCVDSFLSWRGLREWEDLHAQLRRLVHELGYLRNTAAASGDAVHRSLLTGLLSNIGHRGERHEYKGTLGTEFFIHPGSVLFERKPRWVVAAEMAKTGRVYARMVAPVRPEWVVTLGAHLLEATHSAPSWDHRTAAATVIEKVSLLGLALPVKRRVPYGMVNPIHAREMFIRQGLVEGAFRPRADFVEHNDRVIREVRRLEAKARRTDHESEAGSRFDFFDRQLPTEVWSGKRFDRWRHKAEARNPRLLFLRLEDLIDWADEPPAPEAFPDIVEIAGRARELDYRHLPGEPDDGVVLTLPLAAFHELTEAGRDWLVPGLVRERVIEMLRGLPKQARRAIGPSPQVAEDYLASAPRQDRPLAETLAEFVGRTRGAGVSGSMLRQAELPRHVLPRIVVLDEAGHPLASGRDLDALRREVSSEVAEALNRGDSALERHEHARSWEFGEIPEQTRVAAPGGEVTAFPALVDVGEAVSLRLLPDGAGAAFEHRLGVRRLLAIRHKRQLRRTLRDWPAIGGMKLAFAALRLETSLEDEISLLAVERAAGEKIDQVRDLAGFDGCSDRVEQGVDACLVESLDLAGRVLQGVSGVLRLVDQPTPPAWWGACEDVREQLRHLMPERPFSSRGWERLRQLGRYLDAARLRLEKLAGGGLERDTQRWREVEPRWRRWVELDGVLGDLSRSAPVRVELERYRWMVEEFRVSLFAQELGTAGRISAPRLDGQWHLVREALREDPGAASLYAAHAQG
ncbi:MAG: ATP-dependent RNA helicase HrpA [Phycisphaerales bacterium]|nr:ATP-dependent RNA helicase HrpA [Phycisphaerales bacterium]